MLNVSGMNLTLFYLKTSQDRFDAYVRPIPGFKSKQEVCILSHLGIRNRIPSSKGGEHFLKVLKGELN